VWCVCIAWSLCAGAKAPEAVPTEDRAFELYQQAADDFKVRDFVAAVAKLEDAYVLFPKAIILIKLAEGLEHLGRIEEAQQRFADVEPEDVEMSERVQASLRRLSVQLGRPVSVSILTQGLNDVRIVLDGLDIGRVAPTVLELPRGRHVLQLFKPGHEVFVVDPFEVRGIATVVVHAELVPLLYPVTVQVGKQALSALRATVQGEPVPLTVDAQSGRVTLLAPLGEHAFVCNGPSGGTSSTLVVTEREEVKVSCVPYDGTFGALGWSMVTTGSVLFAGGAGLLIWHAVDLDFAARNNLRVQKVAIPDRDIVGPVLMGVGLTVGLLSLVFLLEGGGGGEVALKPSWAPGPSGGMWGLSGRF
jgi:hypothetical protein